MATGAESRLQTHQCHLYDPTASQRPSAPSNRQHCLVPLPDKRVKGLRQLCAWWGNCPARVHVIKHEKMSSSANDDRYAYTACRVNISGRLQKREDAM
jgi:hypothetical protein